MPDPSLVILYVDRPEASAAFYADLLGQSPVEASPTFAMFALPSGFKLGLWARHTVEPAATGAGGGTELAFPVADVDAVYLDWAGRGLAVIQPPTEMDFGRTFVGLDPDGHRLRVYDPVMP
ncbi:VOC family protein [Microvirga terricola]|uniref:Drug:proton antiporter n=1 Tax=Microvirga terricola TaxID=2719797 RepID=A0ABX0VAT9_9HYPH|nr:VOC family protein [Microvirga terricola]NIX76967.1 drug:proton antiporter [Microvirga terricola]